MAQTILDEHVPIHPHIGIKQKKNLFENNQEPDVQRVLKKKVDVMEMDAQKTNEESMASSGTSTWLLIALIIVVIILLIGVAYYIFKNNSTRTGIPYNIIRPSETPPRHHIEQLAKQEPMKTQINQTNYQKKENNNTEHNVSSVPQQSQPPQPHGQEPTEQELQEVLMRAGNNIKESISTNNKDINEIKEQTAETKLNNILDKNIENLILDEDTDDTLNVAYDNIDEIEDFQKKVILESQK